MSDSINYPLRLVEHPDGRLEWRDDEPSSLAAMPGSVDAMMNQPWPLKDVVSKLCEATEILLHEKSYDGHGHEEISHALKVARDWLNPQNDGDQR